MNPLYVYGSLAGNRLIRKTVIEPFVTCHYPHCSCCMLTISYSGGLTTELMYIHVLAASCVSVENRLCSMDYCVLIATLSVCSGIYTSCVVGVHAVDMQVYNHAVYGIG